MNINVLNSHHRDAYISFDEQEHKYTYLPDGREFTCVTSLVEDCFEKFDAPANARRIVAQRGGTAADVQMLLNQWEERGRVARELGTRMHRRIEAFYLDEELPEDSAEPDDELCMEHFMRFANAYKLSPYRTEWRIFHKDAALAGTLDFLGTMPGGSGLYIYDWKRSSKVVDGKTGVTQNVNHYGRRGLGVMAAYPDCAYYHYALQLSVYRYMLEHEYDMSISGAFLGVFHPEFSQPYRVAVPYLEREVERLITHRILKG